MIKVMELKDIIPVLADIHNRLVEVSVRGDDTIRMAEILQKLRAIIFQSSKEENGSGDVAAQ